MVHVQQRNHPITNSIINYIFLCISENNSSKQQLHNSNLVERLLNEGRYNFKLNYFVHFKLLREIHYNYTLTTSGDWMTIHLKDPYSMITIASHQQTLCFHWQGHADLSVYHSACCQHCGSVPN